MTEPVSRPQQKGAEAQPVAWQWRESVGSDWGEWNCLNIPIEKFKEDEKHNFEDGLYEVRPLYAVSGDVRAAVSARKSRTPVLTSAPMR
jgi:hypothetical protein